MVLFWVTWKTLVEFCSHDFATHGASALKTVKPTSADPELCHPCQTQGTNTWCNAQSRAENDDEYAYALTVDEMRY